MSDFQEPEWRDKIKIGNLMGRLLKHGFGEIEMTRTQIAAAKIFLGKTVPDLSSMTMLNDENGKFKIEVTMNVKGKPGDTGSLLPAADAEKI